MYTCVLFTTTMLKQQQQSSNVHGRKSGPPKRFNVKFLTLVRIFATSIESNDQEHVSPTEKWQQIAMVMIKI